MLTKYILTIAGTEHELLDDCIENWDEISFSLKRTDYSGVMRSYSTQFVFCNAAYELLMAEYLANGFLSEASIAVYTITNRWTWEKQFEAPLDFSKLEYENGKLTINALDNALGSIIKANKGQKYEFPVTDLPTSNFDLHRMSIKNSGVLNVAVNTNAHSYGATRDIGIVELTLNNASSKIVSDKYLTITDQSNSNSFFASVNETGMDSLGIRLNGLLRCWLSPLHFSLSVSDITPVQTMAVYTDDENDTFTQRAKILDDDIRFIMHHGARVSAIVGGDLHNIYPTLAALEDAAGSEAVFNHKFGIVGGGTYGTAEYWNNNVVYEYVNGTWMNKGAAKDYYQDRQLDDVTTVGTAVVAGTNLTAGTHVRIAVTSSSSSQNAVLTIQYATLAIAWEDPTGATVTCACVRPVTLLKAIIDKMTSGVTVTIEADTAGVLASTYLVAAETLRNITGAKMYATFQQFTDWMGAVFGYTYRIDGNTLTFTHRSNVFSGAVSKVIESVNDVKYSVKDSLIYATVEAGYAKKDYSQIDGRYEKNFTNYYSTGYTVTDNKMTLDSKFRADAYGIEFSLRKREEETTDDKADNDVFVLHMTTLTTTGYWPTNNEVYSPAVCVANNEGLIAVQGNGADVLLTMTASDGDNALADVTCSNALFTAGELTFSTDDNEMPADPNGLVQLDYGGFRYTGFIQEVESRFGKINAAEYTLIVKEITAL